MLRPIVGTANITGPNNDEDQRLRIAAEASPLVTLETLTTKKKEMLPFVHYSYSTDGDFAICRPHGRGYSGCWGNTRRSRIDADYSQYLSVVIWNHILVWSIRIPNSWKPSPWARNRPLKMGDTHTLAERTKNEVRIDTAM